jgi:hypothetical protein
MLGEVHLVFDPRAPVADELGLVEEHVFRAINLGLPLAPSFQHRLDSGEFQDRVVEGCIKNVGGRYAFA